MPKNETRLNRINEELKKEITQIISYELKNPEATGMMTVTRAKITPDFKYAKIYVSVLNAKNTDQTIEALQKSSGFIRSQIAKRINLRITPELIFELDDSMEYGEKIDNIIKEINKQDEEFKKSIENNRKVGEDDIR